MITRQIKEKQKSPKLFLVLKGLLILIFTLLDFIDMLQCGERDGGWRGVADIRTSCLTVTTSCPGTTSAASCAWTAGALYYHIPCHALNPHLCLFFLYFRLGCWAQGLDVRDHRGWQRWGGGRGGARGWWRGGGLRRLRTLTKSVPKTGQRGA